jgi:hypothetical protein
MPIQYVLAFVQNSRSDSALVGRILAPVRTRGSVVRVFSGHLFGLNHP